MIPPHYQAVDYHAEQRRTALNIARALEKSSVKQVVALSSVGANLASGTGPIAGLHEFEQSLRSLEDLSLTILRPAYFMENHLSSIPLILKKGIMGGGIHKDIPLPMVATRDVALVAAGLLEIAAQDKMMIREILGPRDYTMQEACSILGNAIGKPGMSYLEFDDDDFLKGLTEAGLSNSVAAGLVEMSHAFNTGRIQNGIKRTPVNSTPTPLEKFAQEVFAPAYRGALSLQARGTSAGI